MDERKIADAKDWFGIPNDAEHEVCADGSVWVWLTQILPVGSIMGDSDE